MNITIDRTSPVPIRDQIEAQLKLSIRRGDLRPADRLPTIKELADRLGVNANTVAAVYRSLEAEGLVSTNRRAGTRVADPLPSVPPGEALAARIGAEMGRRLADLGLPVADALPALAAAAQRPGPESLRAAVLGRTHASAEAAARRAQATLGERWVCIPVTPQLYRSVDYHLCVVDPDLASSLGARPNVIPAMNEAIYGHDFPAAAD